MPLDLDDPNVVERLVRYDDLEPGELAALERDPRAAALLARLRSVDRHLRAAGAGDAVTDDSVTDEELYAFGGGPGAEPLEPARAAEVRRHLAIHPEERAWVASLGAHPPSPIIAETLAPEPSPAHERARMRDGALARELRGPRIPAWMAWTPLAAAALVAAMALGGSEPRGVLAGGLPDSPLLRSGARGPLLFPRGRVLAPPIGATAFATRPIFEVPAREGVDAYGFELARLGAEAGAFGAAEVLWRHEGPAPNAAGPPLSPGSYEWRAWLVEGGVERGLGARTFRVVEGPRDLTAAAVGGPSDDAAAIREDVCELHAAGYLTDARHRARALPGSDARDDYLRRSR